MAMALSCGNFDLEVNANLKIGGAKQGGKFGRHSPNESFKSPKAADAGSGIIIGIGLGFLLTSCPNSRICWAHQHHSSLLHTCLFTPLPIPKPRNHTCNNLPPRNYTCNNLPPHTPTSLSILSASSNILILSFTPPIPLTPLFNVPFVGVSGTDPLGISLLDLNPLGIPLLEIPKS
ncbi:hypothetical protein M422DRAFT_244788 [Sphaerobolus stellatus SS14]|uniref:Uncharacterized protein n=1 Tax=Sphaerobolus stellatus (strain SS14) TaxID=990650 RepID=A0A0C9UBH3_SPHS4|nr:hypothetical protein M422DRAFT_256453 [Sphaerobolus stellatus SS14]KIJ50839.1 hypothetical protein M422DRAFT_244788 [Sphaerobolus stellatus SS14]